MSSDVVSQKMPIEQARDILQKDHDQASPAALAAALDTVLATSRATGHRDKISDPSLFTSILELFFKAQTQPAEATLRQPALRCIGNLLADNDTNRGIFTDYPGAIEALRDGIVTGVAGGDEAMLEQATLALKVAYNLCREFTPAQVACLKARLDRAVLQYTTLSMFISENDTLDLALELLADVSQHLRDVPKGIEFDKDFAFNLLQLPQGEEVDLETFDDMAAAISPYLADTRFQETVMTTGLVQTAFELLDRSVFLSASAPDADQGKAFSALVLRSLSDLSTLPDYPSLLSTTLIPILCSRAILTDADPSPLPSVSACILLANAAPSESNATAILSTLDLPKLYSSLTLHAYSRSHRSPQEAADYLHAASGMLRMLSQHPSVRSALAPDDAKPAAASLWSFANPAVQSAGLRLYRAFLPGDTAALQAALDSGHVALLQQIWGSAEDGVKLEVARVVVGLLRDAPAATRQEQAWAVEMVLFAARAEKTPLANVEGFLGLVLLGPAVLGHIDGIVDAARKTLAAEEDEAGLYRRARDNCLVLLKELLSYPSLPAENKTEIEGLLSSAGVSFTIEKAE